MNTITIGRSVALLTSATAAFSVVCAPGSSGDVDLDGSLDDEYYENRFDTKPWMLIFKENSIEVDP